MSKKIKSSINKIVKKINRTIGRKNFYWFIVGLFAFESLWVAFSNSYPLPFDEYYHFGLIDLYSHQWSPFITHQPDYAAVYGDTTRNVSYLYHYLMSFPYRLVDFFTSSFVAKVIIFRLINIVLFAVGLYLFRKLLLKLDISHKLTHLVLLCFMLVPIVPLLAAEPNYDNLIMILLPAILIFAADIIEQKRIRAIPILILLSLSMLAGIVKFPFMPIFLAISVYLAVVLIKRHRSRIFILFWQSYKEIKPKIRTALTIFFLLSLFLFGERYVVNIIKYHNPQPDCVAVQSYDTCAQYSPWIRNQRYIDRYKDRKVEGPVGFTKIWAPKMINDAFIAFTYLRVDPVGIRSTLGDIQTKEALSIPKAMAKILFIGGTILVLLNFGKLWNDSRWRMIFILVFFYAAVLWTTNYSDYQKLRHIVAIQPRYMLIFAPLIMGVMAKSYASLIRSSKIKIVIVTIVMLALIQGGGASIYIIRSYPAWYWPNNTIVWVNSIARNILYKITLVR